MKKIYPKETISQVPDREISELESDFLNSDHGIKRTLSAIQIGLKINEDYKNNSQLLLKELNKEIHFESIRLGVPSAWTIAIVLTENLKETDFPKLRKEFKKWNHEQKELFLSWLKDHPEHIQILTGGE